MVPAGAGGQEGSLSPERRVYRFEDYRVDTRKRVLTRAGETVPLTPKALAILLVLLEDAGKVVEKADLVRRVWPGQFVSEGNLTQNIWSLRRALDERATEARYVATIPGRGYRFVTPVDVTVTDESSSGIPIMGLPSPAPIVPAAAAGLAGTGRRPSLRLVLGGALLVAAGLVALSMHRGTGAQGPAAAPTGLSADQDARLPCVAVLGFRNLSEGGAGGWLEPALAEMLTTELAGGRGLRVVSSANVARVRRSLALPVAAQPDRAILARLHDLAGADRVIVGTYLYIAAPAGRAPIRLDLRVLTVPDGETLTAVSATGTESDLVGIVSRAGADLRRALGFSAP